MRKNSGGFALLLLLLGFALIIIAGIGYYAFKNGQIKLNPTENRANSPTTPSPNLDETANWEIYRHQKLGFEFKYPNNLLKSAESDNANPQRSYYYLYIGFIPKGSNPTAYDLITVTASNEHKTLKDYLDNYWCGGSVNLSSITPIEELLIDGNPTQEIECDDESLPSFNVISKKGEFVYQISAYFGDEHSNYYNKEEAIILLNQILSTFQFTD